MITIFPFRQRSYGRGTGVTYSLWLRPSKINTGSVGITWQTRADARWPPARPMEKGFLLEEEAWAPWPPEGPLALSYLRNSFLPEDVKMMWHVSPLSPFATFSCSQGSLVSHTLTKDFLRLYQAIFLRYKKGIKTKQTTPTSPSRLVLRVLSPSVMSSSLRPARLLCPWDSAGENPGVGGHSLL